VFLIVLNGLKKTLNPTKLFRTIANGIYIPKFIKNNAIRVVGITLEAFLGDFHHKYSFKFS